MVHEPGAVREAEGNVSLPWHHQEISHSARAKVFMGLLCGGKWTSVIKETYEHSHFCLLGQADVQQFRLFVALGVAFERKPLIRVTLEPIGKGGLTVSFNCLNWIVG